MARIYSPLAPVMRGRLGDAVMRKGQNSTVAGKYQPSVANPKTHAQAINRCAWATATQAASALRSIVDHSFEGVVGKRQNLQKFMQLNRERLYGLIMSSDNPGQKVCQLNIKGCPSIVAAPFQLSLGSLPPFLAGFSVVDEGVMIEDNFSPLTGVITTQAEYEEVLSTLGLRPGDQLSMVAISQSDEIAASFESSEGVVDNYYSNVYAARVTFVSQIPEDFSGALVASNTFNPALIKRQEGGGFTVLVSSGEDPNMVLLMNQMHGAMVAAAALVRSQLDINGDFLYSPSSFVLSPQIEKDETSLVLESYEPTTSAAEGSRYFLDNPTRVG